MSLAFQLLSALLAALPVVAIFDGAVGHSLIVLFASVVLLKALTAPSNELSVTARLLKPLSLAIAFPAAWMLLQIVPVPLSSLANPIWSSAAGALKDPSLSGYISLDPGSTLRALMLYVTLLALMASTIVVTQDRQNATTLLVVLCVVSAVISAEISIDQYRSFAPDIAPIKYFAISVIGILLHATMAILLLGRHMRRREQGTSSFGSIVLKLGLCSLGAAICILAVVIAGSKDALVAATFGLLALMIIVFVRRLGIRSWSLGILLAITAAVAVGVGLLHMQDNTTFLAFSPSPSLAVLSRVMADFKWFGTGVGTLGPVTQIYMSYGSEPVLDASSTIAIVALEWGRAALIAMAVIAIQLFAYQLRGALRRGRDYYFSAVAASIVMAMSFEAFADTSLADFPVQVILAVIMGLGMAQSFGRTTSAE